MRTIGNNPSEGRVYAYLYCSDICESGFTVVSLHRTMAGAYRAKQRAQFGMELDALKDNRRYAREIARTTKNRVEKDKYWRRTDTDTAHMIAEYVVNQDIEESTV
jgi:hypothetical protein